jgi:hypothetical protein
MTFKDWNDNWDGKTFTNDERILKLYDDQKSTVAHIQVWEGWTTEEPDILSLRNNAGDTVAHLQAEKGWTTESIKILRLTTNCFSNTLHTQEELLWTQKDKNLIQIKNSKEITVAIMQIKNGWIPPKELKKEKVHGITLQQMYKNHHKSKI